MERYNILEIAHKTQDPVLSICYLAVGSLFPTAIAVNLPGHEMDPNDRKSLAGNDSPICSLIVESSGTMKYSILDCKGSINLCNIYIRIGAGISIRIEDLPQLPFRLYRHYQIIGLLDPEMLFEDILGITKPGKYVITSLFGTCSIIVSLYATDVEGQSLDISDCKKYLQRVLKPFFEDIEDIATIVVDYLFPLSISIRNRRLKVTRRNDIPQ